MGEMLVTEGLNELKTLAARIDRAISEASFVKEAKTCEKNVTPNVSKEEFTRSAQSSYDSIIDLIDRREKIKAAIVESNAKTTVEICGQTLTVAKAIDLKSSIEYKKLLLSKLKRDRGLATVCMTQNNEAMKVQVDKLLESVYGKESKNPAKESEYDAIAKPYITNNEYSLVSISKLDDIIKELETYIEEFESTVDSKLQISNCTTYIEV